MEQLEEKGAALAEGVNTESPATKAPINEEILVWLRKVCAIENKGAEGGEAPENEGEENEKMQGKNDWKNAIENKGAEGGEAQENEGEENGKMERKNEGQLDEFPLEERSWRRA